MALIKIIKPMEKLMTTSQDLVNRFNQIKSDKNIPDSEKNPKLEAIANELIASTIETYDLTAVQYSSNSERAEIDPFNKSMWDIFVGSVKQHLATKKKIKVLDIGSGSGRDLLYGQTLGFDMYGIEVPDGFLTNLDKLHTGGKIKHRVKKCDMREMDFEDKFFDAVKHNATLLHMPVVGKGYSIDKALQEAHRVLKKGGLLQVLVKKGTPELSVHDTKEGLGGRVFQFFTMDLIKEVIKRNGFEIVLSENLQNQRPNEVVDWLFLMARKF